MVRRILDSNGSTSGGVSSIWFGAFDGYNPTLELDGTAATDVTHRYLWSPATGELLSDEIVTSTGSAGTIQWALADQVGTIRDIARWNSGNSEFEVANHRVYSSFGEFESETNSAIDLTFGFTGQWTDPETGYTFHLNRWFDPKIGKWLSEDPIGFAAGDPNLTRYVTNRAITHLDPLGLDEALGREAPNTGTGSGALLKLEQQDEEEDSEEDPFVVVLSGFPGFNGREDNASRHIAWRLANALNIDPDKLIVHYDEPDVEWDVFDVESRKWIKGVGPRNVIEDVLTSLAADGITEVDLWIAFGEGSDSFSIETTGRNRRQQAPDNHNQIPGIGGIPIFNDPNAPPDDTTDIGSPDDLAEKLKGALVAGGHDNTRVRISDNAGGYICDATVYFLGSAEEEGDIKDAIFIHILPGLGLNDPDNSETRDDILIDVVKDYVIDAADEDRIKKQK